MAEVHPNDIGLATFEDVGNVQKLKTTAKSIVDAINEVYETGSNSAVVGEQLFVEGEDNVIIGENNTVYGNNNIVIGSDNSIVGDNMIIFQNNQIFQNANNYSINSLNLNDNTVYFLHFNPEIENLDKPGLPFKVGDKLLLNCSVIWATETLDDYITINHKSFVAEISEVNQSDMIVKLDGVPNLRIPPDDTHTEIQHCPINVFVGLIDGFKVSGQKTAINMGAVADGIRSIALNNATAQGLASFAANGATTTGANSTAVNAGSTFANSSFAANNASCKSFSSSSFNNGTTGAPFSLAFGYESRTSPRAIRCSKINPTTHSITVASGQSTAGLTGKRLLLRYRVYTSVPFIEMLEVEIKSVSNTEIFLDEDTYLGTSSAPYILAPDGMAYLIDPLSTLATSNAAGGSNCIAVNMNSFANGYYTIAQYEGSTIFGKNGMTDADYSFAIGNGTTNANLGLAFKVLQNGSVHADNAFSSPCADYAEFFEWNDGNPDNEDRVGYFVKIEDGKIVKCSDFDTPLGVVSAAPAIIGDSGELRWQGKYITDDFGRIQYHDVVIPAELDDAGNVIIEEHTETQPILNPEWNNEEAYIPRKDRPEWAAVGVLGKLIVYDDGTLNVGDKCRCGNDGKAVKSVNDGYTVLKRISEDKVLIWFKG